MKYNEKQNNYSIFDHGVLSITEVLAMLLGLMGSDLRISADRFSKIQKDAIQMVATDERRTISNLLINLHDNYAQILKRDDNLDQFQQLLNGIINQQTIYFTYQGQINVQKGVPLSIYSNNGHFYALVYYE